MRKPTEKEPDFYESPKVTFLGKAAELTAGITSPVAEGFAGSGKWYNANPPDSADEGVTEADEGSAYKDEGVEEKQETDEEESE